MGVCHQFIQQVYVNRIVAGCCRWLLLLLALAPAFVRLGLSCCVDYLRKAVGSGRAEQASVPILSSLAGRARPNLTGQGNTQENKYDKVHLVNSEKMLGNGQDSSTTPANPVVS
jgi:hypothetical protein